MLIICLVCFQSVTNLIQYASFDARGNGISKIGMFRNCFSLVGENGTSYDENHTDGNFACLDTNFAKGYFSDVQSRDKYVVAYLDNQSSKFINSLRLEAQSTSTLSNMVYTKEEYICKGRKDIEGVTYNLGQ